jgi:hypothetical protein
MKQTHVFIIIFVTFWTLIVLWRLITIMDSNNSMSCPPGKICLEQNEYRQLVSNDAEPHSQASSSRSLVPQSYTRERDLRVLNDPLYPALNRSDKQSFEGVVQKTVERKINVPTHYYSDSYRLLGYLTNEEDPIKTWKLMGKQTDRNRGSYYMVPTNAMYDMKIQITDDIVSSEKLRDLDTIPNEVRFKTPLLKDTPYVFSELPKGDLRDELDI